MLSLTHVSFRYPGQSRKVLQDITLTLDAGKVYGLLGSNGAGKTTLLKIMAGLLSPESGECRLQNARTRERHPHTLGQVFYIPEECELPAMTLVKFERFVAPFYPKFSSAALHDFTNRLQIPKDVPFPKLSYGQRKKFMLAFAIATHCPLVLFDEPTNGLDIPSQETVRQMLVSALGSERTFLISTHHVRELSHTFDHILILNNERIVLDASQAELARTSGTPLDLEAVFLATCGLKQEAFS